MPRHELPPESVIEAVPAFRVVLLVQLRELEEFESSHTPQVASTSLVPTRLMAPLAVGSSA